MDRQPAPGTRTSWKRRCAGRESLRQPTRPKEPGWLPAVSDSARAQSLPPGSVHTVRPMRPGRGRARRHSVRPRTLRQDSLAGHAKDGLRQFALDGLRLWLHPASRGNRCRRRRGPASSSLSQACRCPPEVEPWLEDFSLGKCKTRRWIAVAAVYSLETAGTESAEVGNEARLPSVPKLARMIARAGSLLRGLKPRMKLQSATAIACLPVVAGASQCVTV